MVHAIRDRAMLPGPPATWASGWNDVPASAVSAEDIAHWPYTASLLVKWVAFWALNIGLKMVLISGLVVFPVFSYSCFMGSGLELLILYELWAGERLVLEKAHPSIFGQGAQCQCRLFLLVQALIFGAPVGLLVP